MIDPAAPARSNRPLRFRAREAARVLAVPAAVAAAGAGLLVWSWGKWPDVLVDFGRELYVPWRLAAGEVLYRDVAYSSGPLPPYLDALLFRFFGEGIRTLVVANLAILAALTGLLLALLERLGDRVSAAVGGVLLMAVFAFAQLTEIGNYNHVCPYSHGMTHGLVLAVAALACLGRVAGEDGAAWAAGAGVATGLVFLTRAELFVGSVLAAVAVFAGIAFRDGARAGRLAAPFVLAGFAPPLAALSLLGLAMRMPDALRGTLGDWPWALDARVRSLAFYREGLGTLDAPDSLRRLLVWSAAWAFALGAPVALSLARAPSRAVRRAAAAALVAAVGVSVALTLESEAWADAARPLPLFLLVAGGAWAIRLRRRRRDPGPSRQALLALGAVALSLGLLLKMILNARIQHYGFVLALPAAMVLVVAVGSWIPDWVARRGGDAGMVRVAGLAILLVSSAPFVLETDEWLAAKDVPVGEGADRFLADARGREVNAALGAVRRHVGPGRTLAVFPQGLMINYLARRAAPDGFPDFMPPEVVTRTEARILASLRERPPDFVLLQRSALRGGRFEVLGEAYGGETLWWIVTSYRPVEEVRASPTDDPGLGFLLLEKAPAGS